MWLRIGILTAALITASVSTGAAAAFTIAADGHPRATIVIGKEAFAKPAKEDERAAKARSAAEDLRDCIERTSGAKLEIVAEDAAVQGPLILIGRSRLTDALQLQISNELTTARKEEGF